MLHNIPSIPSTIKKREYAFKSQRYTQKRRVFYWTTTSTGCLVKAVLGAYAESRNPNLHMDGKFKEYGLTPKLVYTWACGVMPWLPAWFLENAGRELTPTTLFDRLHKQFYKDNRHYRTPEHYTIAKIMRDYITKAERIVLEGKPTKQP